MERIKFVLSSFFGTFFGTLALLPALALAQNTGGNLPLTSLQTFIQGLKALMNMVVPILIGLAIIVFLYGVLKFVFNAGNEEKRSDGKYMMLYGIIGIVVMVSVWGLVGFVQQTFGIQTATSPQNLPTLSAVTKDLSLFTILRNEYSQ